MLEARQDLVETVLTVAKRKIVGGVTTAKT